MRLIDGEALYKQVAESEEKARDRFLDTSSSLPCPSYINPAYTRYNEQLNERTKLKHMIADAPTIVEFEGDINKVIVKGEEYHKQLTTTWIGSYSPYTCQHCGKHTDSKTPYCPYCGRKMVE